MTSPADVPADVPAGPIGAVADPRQRLRIIIVVTSVLIAIAAGTATLVSTVSPPGVPSHVVGQYSGLTIQEVRAAAEANAWVLDEDQVRTNTAQVGIVINQNPLPETLLQEGELLNVDVASGPLLVQLPTVAGLSVDEAVELLEASGFVVGLIAPSSDASEPDEQVPGERVIELVVNSDQPASLLANQLIDPSSSGTDSDAGYEPGTVVTLIVSPGTQPPDERRNVPNLVGLTLAQARVLAQDAGLELEVVVASADGVDGGGTDGDGAGADSGTGDGSGGGTDNTGDGNDGGSGAGDTGDSGTDDSESSSESVVIAQNPPAGQSVAAGSSVNVTVASDTSSNS